MVSTLPLVQWARHGVSAMTPRVRSFATTTLHPRRTHAWGTWLGLADPSVAVSTERAMWCSDFALLRLTAEFSNFDGTEIATAQTVPGIQIYHKMVEVPDGCDTLYVTISATADESFDAMWLTCKVDFVFCNPGPTFETRTPGWLAIQNIPGNFEDNSIYYTWCTAITPGTH